MSEPVPTDDDRIGEINEAFTNCDQCQGLFWWDDMLTDDGGAKWFCPKCYGGQPMSEPREDAEPWECEGCYAENPAAESACYECGRDRE